MATADSRDRIQALRALLEDEVASTQEELREKLEHLDFTVNQSTISRDLRRLGAVKTMDATGRTTYRLSLDSPPGYAKSVGDLVRFIEHNGAMVVIGTDPGSASLVARHVDNIRTDDILGTIAGDDTIFVAPASIKKVDALTKLIRECLAEAGL
jgi:transcriptional regulator of arginine metabolism